ncbi:hypothetical protein [Brucella sp. JSBI001]|uniref:hypothetical protein n=1 Tax=Brucella sp. JSBI001 TaxID=2886044 RepID=UPI00223174B1|nr:hypothetical protein [Brucella sp. JSBI001]UZD69368.1 hypothetical protein LJ361_20005 [Brucella sp. JSBI001]
MNTAMAAIPRRTGIGKRGAPLTAVFPVPTAKAVQISPAGQRARLRLTFAGAALSGVEGRSRAGVASCHGQADDCEPAEADPLAG